MGGKATARLTVLAYLINNPQHAAQRGRRMTRKGSLNSAFAFYLSVYMYDACRIAVEDGYLVPLYGLGASREDVVMSVVQAERRLADFTNEDSAFDITENLRLSIDSLRTGGGSDGQSAIVFADPPSGKRHKRAGEIAG